MATNASIRIKNVWKVFGDTTEETFKKIRSENISKDDALAKYDCVIGVADASFDVFPGEIFCIMGLSGSGKSTLVRHINRLLDPTAGSIEVNGQDIISLTEKELRIFRNDRRARPLRWLRHRR